MTKICKVCHKELDISEFYEHKKMEDGHLNKCKSCCKAYEAHQQSLKRQNPIWMEKEKERSRKKYHRLNYKEKYPYKKNDNNKRYEERYPEKKAATNATANMKRKEGYNLHHWSYKPEHQLDVLELSIEQHYAVHRHTVYDQEQMMYRSKDGVLLDTKESYLEYVKQFIH